MKLTDWIPGDIKPVRVGVYQRRTTSDGYVAWSYWNGRYWGSYEITAEWACLERKYKSGFQNIPWRGLAEKPE